MMNKKVEFYLFVHEDKNKKTRTLGKTHDPIDGLLALGSLQIKLDVQYEEDYCENCLGDGFEDFALSTSCELCDGTGKNENVFNDTNLSDYILKKIFENDLNQTIEYKPFLQSISNYSHEFFKENMIDARVEQATIQSLNMAPIMIEVEE